MQGFFPNDRMAYPLYEAIAEEGAIALFHTGQTGVGSGMRGGMGMRLKYSNPIHIDDVAVDFPDMTIVLAHPSFPWTEEGLAIAQHKPNVYIDMSGWSPKYFPAIFVHYANTILKRKMLFGSDWPAITPDRWLEGLRGAADQGRGPPADPQGQRPAHPQALARVMYTPAPKPGNLAGYT
jgi:uncharacterized protein